MTQLKLQIAISVFVTFALGIAVGMWLAAEIMMEGLK